VAWIVEQQPDVVIMDLQMPVMDGVEATRLIKRQWPAIKVIVVTVQAARRGEAFVAGADHFLLKGDGPEALQHAIQS
jgi:CheY-like chemotaxis protein